jgi:hypothetical protein
LALAVMALGMMGLVGVQSTLRNTSDVAKQRSEAVRIAQVEIERWRAFTALAGGGGTNYGDMADAVAATVRHQCHLHAHDRHHGDGRTAARHCSVCDGGLDRPHRSGQSVQLATDRRHRARTGRHVERAGRR